MNEQERKIPSIASLFPDLAWNLLTSEQQQQLLEYLEKAHNHEKSRMNKEEKERGAATTNQWISHG